MTPKGRYVLGIDLGTTNTLCAVWNEGEPAPTVVPVVQPTFDREHFEARSPLPSAVLIEPAGVYVGEYPRELSRYGSHPGLHTSIKREMGTPWLYREGKRSWTADQVSACILRAVRQGIGLSRDDPPPARVVITVPACFDFAQRRATLRAARLAGFDPARTDLFDEPAAALLHHTRAVLGKNSWPEPKRLMVLDIGGGTLDVSCMTLHGRGDLLTADVLGRSRYNELAGDDFDLNLAGLLLDRFQRVTRRPLEQLEPGPRKQLCAGLAYEAERAKRHLCEQAAALPEAEHGRLYYDIDVMNNTPLHWRARVMMADLGRALQPFFRRHKESRQRLTGYSFYTAIEECVKSMGHAGVTDPARPPDHVFLAGGSSGLPFIREVVRNHFAASGRAVEAQTVDRPMEAVALGAAWYAGTQSNFRGGGEVKLVQRMHEGVYLLTASGRPLQLVDPAAKLKVEETELPHDLGTGTSERIEIDLVTGTGPDDVRMRPMERLVVTMDGFVQAGSRIRLTVAVDDSRSLSLRCVGESGGKQVTGEVEFHNGSGWQNESDHGPALPPVNPMTGGYAP